MILNLMKIAKKSLKVFFCSEICFYSWVESYPNCSFTKRQTFGVDTVMPIDFIDAAECSNPKTILLFDGRK